MALNNCGSATDEVIVAKGTCKVAVPTAFHPNNDGKNDLFRILGVEMVADFHLRVFNRWGQMVFETGINRKVGTAGSMDRRRHPNICLHTALYGYQFSGTAKSQRYRILIR
jgi:gliding motility-associated-like protein